MQSEANSLDQRYQTNVHGRSVFAFTENLKKTDIAQLSVTWPGICFVGKFIQR